MNKSRWADVTEAELAATGKVKRGNVAIQSAQVIVSKQAEILARLTPTKTSRFDWADILRQQCHVCALPEPVRDYRFDPIRRWKMDLAWVALKVSCEVDGNEWAQTNGKRGRHGGGKGMQSDCEKLNAALLAGWRPFRFVGSQVTSGYALGVLEIALKSSEGT